MQCPNCHHAMQEQKLAGNYGTTVALDLCYPCNGLWFDRYENLQLTPGTTLRLFTIIYEKHADRHNPLGESLRCPRCGGLLTSTTDMQRATRFHYFRCLQEHGRFITFFQFLREKNFVRSLDAKEVSELVQYIKILNCSNCGAAIDLEKDSACAYCRTPLAMLDPRQIEKTARELRAAEEKRTSVDPLLPAQLIMNRLKTESEWSRYDRETAAGSDFLDLIQEGLAVVIDAWGGETSGM